MPGANHVLLPRAVPGFCLLCSTFLSQDGSPGLEQVLDAQGFFNIDFKKYIGKLFHQLRGTGERAHVPCNYLKHLNTFFR